MCITNLKNAYFTNYKLDSAEQDMQDLVNGENSLMPKEAVCIS